VRIDFFFYFLQNDFQQAMGDLICQIEVTFESEHISIAHTLTTFVFKVKAEVNILDPESSLKSCGK